MSYDERALRAERRHERRQTTAMRHRMAAEAWHGIRVTPGALRSALCKLATRRGRTMLWGCSSEPNTTREGHAGHGRDLEHRTSSPVDVGATGRPPPPFPDPECPGPDCPMCNGAACDRCGAGATRQPWLDGVPCNHDVIDRHDEG